MTTNQNKRYFANNKEGHMCSYDAITHRCVSVPLYTGCDVEYVMQHEKEWIGQLDPKYEEQNNESTL